MPSSPFPWAPSASSPRRSSDRAVGKLVQADGTALAVVAAEEPLDGVQEHGGVALGLTQLGGRQGAVLTLRREARETIASDYRISSHWLMRW